MLWPLAMMSLFAYAFALGLLFNATPGAIFAETLRQGLRGGFAPALAVQIGSLVGDSTWVVLGLAGAAALLSLPHVELPLALAGAALLAWLGLQALRDAFRPMPPIASVATTFQGHGKALYLGAALSLSNPLNITYWAALGGTITALIGARPTAADYGIFIAGFLASSLLWCFIAAGLVALLRRHLNAWLWRSLNLITGTGLLYLALLTARNALA